MTLAGEATDRLPLISFYNTRPAHLSDERRHFTLNSGEIALINPDTHTLPIFRSQTDAELTKRIYERVPVLIDETKGAAGNQWRLSFSQGLFNMASDSGLFRTSDQLANTGLRREGADWIAAGGARWVPLYEAKMFDLFDHRAASYASRGKERGHRVLPPTPADRYADPLFFIEPFYWVPSAEVDTRLRDGGSRQWLLGFKDVSTAITERSFVATLFPRGALVIQCPS